MTRLGSDSELAHRHDGRETSCPAGRWRLDLAAEALATERADFVPIPMSNLGRRPWTLFETIVAGAVVVQVIGQLVFNWAQLRTNQAVLQTIRIHEQRIRELEPPPPTPRF